MRPYMSKTEKRVIAFSGLILSSIGIYNIASWSGVMFLIGCTFMIGVWVDKITFSGNRTK